MTRSIASTYISSQRTEEKKLSGKSPSREIVVGRNDWESHHPPRCRVGTYVLCCKIAYSFAEKRSDHLRFSPSWRGRKAGNSSAEKFVGGGEKIPIQRYTLFSLRIRVLDGNPAISITKRGKENAPKTTNNIPTPEANTTKIRLRRKDIKRWRRANETIRTCIQRLLGNMTRKENTDV